MDKKFPTITFNENVLFIIVVIIFIVLFLIFCFYYYYYVAKMQSKLVSLILEKLLEKA